MNLALNKEGRFLRGGLAGPDTDTYVTQEDAMQEHDHDYTKTELANYGNFHMEGITDFYNSIYNKEMCSGGVHNANVATETRPKNMKVMFMMKCWHNSDN